MAAVDEGGSRSENKNEYNLESNCARSISVMQQEVESQVCRQNASYSDKVNAVLQGWECLASNAHSSASLMISFATFLYKWTLKLVLQGEWPGLQRILKTRLSTSLHRCSQDTTLAGLVNPLLPLVTNPWEGAQLKLVLDSDSVSAEDGAAYLSSEPWDVVRMRVDALLEARCEQFAYRVLTVCFRSLRDPECALPAVLDDDREHFTDLYHVLLYKFDRNAFLNEVKQLPVEEGVALVQRLLHRTDTASRVWKNRLKIADIASKVFLATTIVKEYAEIFWHVFSEWCGVQLSVGVSHRLLEEMVRKYICLAYSQQHLYTMGSVLHFKCEGQLQNLVIELLIRGLTLDMNDIETLKLRHNEADNSKAVADVEQRMSLGFLELASVFEQHAVVSRECVLTAFSLHPTEDKLQKLQQFAEQELTSSPSKIIVSGPVQLERTPEKNKEVELLEEKSQLPHVTRELVFDKSVRPETGGPDDAVARTASPSRGVESGSATPGNDGSDFPTSLTTPCIASAAQESASHTSPGYTSPGYTSPARLSPCSQSLEGKDETCKARLSPSQEPSLPFSNNVQNEISECGNNLLEIETQKVGSVNIVVDTGQPPTPSLSLERSQVSTNGSQELVSNSEPSSFTAGDDRTPQENAVATGAQELQLNTLQSSLLESTSNNEETNVLVTPEPLTPQVSVSLPLETKTSTSVTSDSFTHDTPYASVSLPENTSLNVDAKSGDTKMHNENFDAKSPSAAVSDIPPEDETEASPVSHSLIPATSTLGANCDILTNPGEVLDESKLGLPKELCDDLAVVLSSPRWQGLSWMFGWRHLGPLCQQYFVDSNAVKNLTKELKYLDIDYTQFRHLPCVEVDEFSGIEKGYEQFMYEEEAEAVEPTCDQTLVLMNQKQDSATEIRPNRGRGKVKSSYYDSDSDYDSGGFQKFRSAESDSDGEGFRNSSSKGVSKNRSSRSSDGGWVHSYGGKQRVKKVTHKDRRKRLRIDQAIESVIARHTQDVSGSANSSTNDDSLDNSTGESDVADAADGNDCKTGSIPDIVMIGSKGLGVGSRSTTVKGKSTSIHSSRALMMKKYNVPNSLRFFRKPGLPYQPGSEGKSKKTLALPYSIEKAAAHEITLPKQSLQGNLRCPLNFCSHASKGRAPHLISVPQRLPGPRTILSLNSSKELPILGASQASTKTDRSDSPEIIEFNPREAINSVRTIKSVMYNSKGIPIGTMSKGASPPIHRRKMTQSPRKQSPIVTQTFYRQLKQESLVRNNVASVRMSHSPSCGQLQRYPAQGSSLPTSSISSPLSMPKTSKRESQTSSLLPFDAPRLSSNSSPSREEVNSSVAGSESWNMSKSVNSKWRHPGCLYGPPTPSDSRKLTPTARCTCKTSDGRVISLLPYGSMRNMCSGSGSGSGLSRAGKSDAEGKDGGDKTHSDGRQLVRANDTAPKTYSTSSSHAKSMNNITYKNKNSLTVQRPITVEAIAKILMEQEENGTILNTKALLKNSSVTITRKQIPMQDVLDKRKHGKFSFDDRQPLASAQKNVLNRIMSHDNGFSSLSAAIRPPIRAMPVTHTPPNIVPDKNGAGLGRILPKGTTVVRKNQNDPSSSHGGAGPSGMNNGGGVSNASQSESVRSRNVLTSRVSTQTGPSRFIAQNIPSTSSVIHSVNSSANVSGNSTQLPTSTHPAVSTPVTIIGSSSYTNNIIRSGNRTVVTHHNVSSPGATFVITSNSSLSQVNASMMPIGNDRDGIILSSGIGNQVFTHSDGSNSSGRDIFLDHDIIAVSSATTRSNNLASSSANSHLSISSTPTIASLLDASSVLELTSSESPQGLTSFPNTTMSSSNFLERNILSNNIGGASSGASPAPLDYATLVGGALNIGRTLGGAPGDERNIAFTTTSTVASQPRDQSIPTEMRSVSTVSNADTVDDSFANTPTHVTASSTARFGGSLISAGGGLLGRVLAASGVSGVRLLGGSCVSVTTESSTISHTTLNSLSSSTTSCTVVASVASNLDASVRNTVSNSGSSSVIASTDAVSSDFNSTEDSTVSRVAGLTVSPGASRSQSNGASSGGTSMLETLLRDSPSKRPSSVNIKISTSSGVSVMGSDVPSSTSTASTTTSGSTSDINSGNGNSIVANSSLASLLSSGTVITSGNQIRFTSSSPVTQTLSPAVALHSNQTVSLELQESSSSETSYLLRSSEDSIASNEHRSDLRYSSGPALLDAGNARGGGSVVLGAGSTSNSVLLNSGSSLPSNVVLASGSSAPSNGVLLSPGGSSDSGTGLQQVLVPAQLVHVQTGDGSTGLGLVHSTGLDIRLPAGTRVIKSSSANSLLGGTMTRSGSGSNTAVAATSAALGANARQVNLLQNVKIVQNRQIVRTVVVPNSVTLQGIASSQPQGAHLVAISSGGTNSGLTSETIPLKVTTSKAGAARAIGGPCGLVIRTVRPQLASHGSSGEAVIHEKSVRRQEVSDRTQVQIRSNRVPTDEGLAERLNRHYLKTVGQLNASTTVQSVGTQTQTTAVKNTAGQLVSQVVMNNIGGTATVSSLPTTAVLSVASSNTSQDSSLNALPLAHSNAVSSETLEQLREFESVFEKVSNKSTKDEDEVAPTVESFPVVMAPTATTSAGSTEESMIAAQLLSMANETPVRSTPSYVYSLPSSSSSQGAYISLPTTTTTTTAHGGALIVVNNPSMVAAGSNLGPSNSSHPVPQQPQPPASPALSTTSSHSSVASSPSSTPSKKKPQASKTKIVASACVAGASGGGGGSAGPCGSSNAVAVAAAAAPAAPSALAAAAAASASSASSNAKTPPPPKAPPKPQVAKPQVEDNDEIRARIKVILENYKMLLAETPQQQPAPRNRKNCPPSRSDSKSPGKKKSSSSGKKIDGSSTNSPIASDPGTSASPSPATSATPTPGSMAADGATVSETNTVIQVASNLSSPFPADEKVPVVLKSEGASPNVVVTNAKTEKSTIVGSVSNVQTLPQTIATGGRIVQLIRTGSKVTAITTRQPLYKTKHGLSSSQSGGPPPNVTIQGRINMSNIMESHLASLLTGNSQPSILGKKISNSDGTGGTVLLQTQSGQFIQANQIGGSVGAGNATQVIQSIGGGQQVVHSAGGAALVQLPPGQQVIHTATGQVVQLGAAGTLLSSSAQVVSAAGIGSNSNCNMSGSCSSDSSVQTVLPGSSAKVIQTSGGDATLHTIIPGDSAIVHHATHGREGSAHIVPQQQTIVVQQQQHLNAQNPGVIKRTVSRTPDSANHDDNSDSEQASDGVTLPPFFTLAKPFLGVSKAGNAGQSVGRKPGAAATEAAAVVAAAVSLANQSKSSLNNVTLYSLETRGSVTTTSSAPNSAGSSSLSPSTPAPVSVNDDSRSSFQSSIADEGGLYRGVSDEGSSAYQGAAEETLVYSADRPVLESGTRSHHLIPRSGAVLVSSNGRTSSLDSLKSDLSTEEVQVPPSPSTLTKQLQNAYMTDAALSPSLVQQQGVQQLQHHLNTAGALHANLALSNSGESDGRDEKHHQQLRISNAAAASSQQQRADSPSVSQDMHFPLSPSVYQSPQGSNSPSCVGGGVNPSCSVSGGPGSASSSVMIQSPSGDVYLDGSGPALNSLDTMPLVAGMEGRVHSPALSDLVTSGTLLPWSPRSADSMMAQSPTIHDTLSANMGLDVPHPSDTLCDSSTPFPVLFSMEGDGASVSSNASEDLPFRTTSREHCSIDEVTESPSEDVGSTATSLQEHVSFSTQDHIGGLSSKCTSPDGQELRLNSDNGPAAHGSHRSSSYSISNAGGVNTRESPSTNITEPIRDTPWRFESVLVSNITNMSSSPPRCALLNCVNSDDEEEVDDVLSMESKELNDGDDRKEMYAKNGSKSDPDSEQLASSVSSATFANETIRVEPDHGLILSGHLMADVDKELKNEVKSENESESRFTLMDALSEEAKINDRKSKVADDKTYGGRRRFLGRKRPSDETNSTIEPELESEPKRPKEESPSEDATHDVSATSPSEVNVSVNISSTSVVTRSRNTTVTSDASSYGLTDPLLSEKPSLRDSPPVASGRRRRCGSGVTSGNAPLAHMLNVNQECEAVCAANDSPNTIQMPLSSSGMTTRRASNRDHTKRQRCSCCSGDGVTHSVSVVPSTSLLRPSPVSSSNHDCDLPPATVSNVTSTSESQCGSVAVQVHSSSVAESLHETSTMSSSSSSAGCSSTSLSNSTYKKGTSGGNRRTSARMNKSSGGFDAKINDKRR